MKRSNWVRLIAVILIISMLAAPVSAATSSGYDGVRTNGLIGFIVEIIRDIIRDIFDDWFDKPGDGEPVPTEPIETTAPTAPGESEPTEPGETEPGETKPTTPGETKPTEPDETEPDEEEPTNPGETEPEETEPEEETSEYELNLIEGYENTTNGHLLRAETYSLSQVIAQQTKPLTTATANRFGTKLGNSLGGNALSTGLKTMAVKGGVQTMAETETTVSDTPLTITYDENGNAIIPNGDYVVHHYEGIGSYLTVNSNTDNPWSAKAITGAMEKSGASYLTFTRLNNGTYTIQGPGKWYLTIPANNQAYTQSTSVAIEIKAHSDGNGVTLRDTNSNKYMNALDYVNKYPEGKSYFGGWSDGSPFVLYRVTDGLDLGLTVTARYMTNRLSWNAQSDVTYTVERSVDNETWTTLGTATTGSYLDETAGKGTQYYYRITVDDVSTASVRGLTTGMNALKQIAVLFYSGNDDTTFDGSNKVVIADGDEAAALNTMVSGTIVYKAHFNSTSGIQAVMGTDNGKFVGAKDGKFRHQLGNLMGQHDTAHVTADADNTAGFTYNDANGYWYMSSNGSAMDHIDLDEANYGILTDVNASTYYAGGSSSDNFNGTINYIMILSEVLTDAELSALTAANKDHDEPDVPVLPEGEGKVVYFPVTMFNYDTNDMNVATHIKEIEAAGESDPTTWNGIYFSSGSPAGYNGPTGEYTVGYRVTYEMVVPEFDSAGNISNLDAESEYILINKRCGKAAVDGTNSVVEGSSVVSNRGDATIKLEFAEDQTITELGGGSIWKYGTYTSGGQTYTCIKTAAGEYLTIGYTTSGTASTQTATYVQKWNSDSKCVVFKQGNNYLSDYQGGNNNVLVGWNDSGDVGNPFYIYKKVSTEQINIPVTKDYTNVTYANYNHFKKGSDQSAGDKFYTGLVKDTLNFETNPKGELEFIDQIEIANPGIFSFDPTAISAENNYYDGVKNVYEFVGMPFVQTVDKGNVVYTFDSDAHGVYFDDIDGDTYNDPAPGTASKNNYLRFDYGVPQPLGIPKVKDGSENGWFPYNLYTTRSENGVIKTDYGMLPLPSDKLSNPNIDYHFGMRADLQFSMTTNGRIKETDDTSTPITFHFSGDDDVWIYIDGMLVADLGGLHNRFDIEIDFATNTVVYSEHNDADDNNETGSYNDSSFSTTQKLFKTSDNDNALIDMTRNAFASSGNHTIQFFYLERGEGTSNCMIQFNLPMRDAILVTKEANKSWSAAQDVFDEDNGDGTLDLTPEEQSAVDAMNFGFTLYKAPGSCLDENGQPVVDDLSFEPVAATNYYVLNRDGIVIDIRSTNEQGRFYIRNNETAKFITDIPGTGMTYYVVEDDAPEGFLTPDYKYDGETTYDIAYYGFTMNQDDHNTSRKVFGTTDLPSKLGEHELPMNATENNSYYITGRGSIEATDTLEFICVNYLEQDDQPHAQEDIIVIDYGLPVQLDPMENDLIRGEFVEGIEIVAVKPGEHTFNITDGNTENEDQTDDLDVYIPAEGEFSLPELPVEGAPEQTIAGHSGTFTFENVDYTPAGDRMPVSRDRFTYTLNKQLTEVEVLSYLIAVNIYTNAEKTETKTEYTQAKVYIVPATIMYYEENFDGLVSYTGTGEQVGEQRNEDYVSEFQEPGVVGTIGDSTYGSDVAYLNDSYDSNGTSYKLNTTDGSVRFKYTFTGTGTTFFARTSAHTAYMQVLIFNGDLTFEEAVAAASKKEQIDTYYRDTYYNDTNGYAQDESGTLYNIPVYTYDALQYGTYTVVVSIAKAGTKGAGPSVHSTDANGNLRYYLNEDGSLKLDDEGNPIPIYENRSEPEFYLDGIRIMQPLKEVVLAEAVEDEETGELISPTLYDALTTRAHNAYTTDGEAHLNVVTLRHKLLDEFDPGYDEESGEEEPNWPFAVLTDTNGNLVKHSEYETIGPKEEVYLAPAMPTEDGGVNAQKVTFSLKYWQPEGLKLYMGMKAPFGSATVKVGDREFDLYNATDCYYDVSENRTSLEVKYDQIFDENGYPLFTDPDGRDVYKDDDGNYFYSEGGSAVPDGTELEPKYDLSTKHHVVTYSFEAINSIVSLTNIKVVGSHEFIILEAPDVITPGDEDLNEEGTE